ncbi:hypothetical protein A4X09_0g332 [Tilletia walkeri]|uniref:Uncharacterized protein n=1 Tax=Tilletia walkeri TaxID=117179 RepID=A0A8X7T8I7_9BASI|nr:hypothetical protein A4X09_0g332 [Tilletia walkeri]
MPAYESVAGPSAARTRGRPTGIPDPLEDMEMLDADHDDDAAPSSPAPLPPTSSPPAPSISAPSTSASASSPPSSSASAVIPPCSDIPTWKQRVDSYLASLPKDQVAATSIETLMEGAPVFAPWFDNSSAAASAAIWGLDGNWRLYGDALSKAFSRTSRLRWESTVQKPRASRIWMAVVSEPRKARSNTQRPQFFRRGPSARADMGDNISEAREYQRYGVLKAWAEARIRDTSEQNGLEARKNHSSKRSSESASTSTHKLNKRLKLDADSLAAKERRARNPTQRALPKKKDECIPTLTLRLYPSVELASKLQEWEVLAKFIRDMARQRIQKAADQGEKIDPFTLADRICLTTQKWEGMDAQARASIPLLQRMLVGLPADFQREQILKVASNAQSAQANYERGHSQSYRLDVDDEERDNHHLFFTSDALGRKGALFPRVLKHLDSRLYVRDRILSRPGEKRRKTAEWVDLLTGADRSFSIHRRGQKWYIRLAYDAWEGPFKEKGKATGIGQQWQRKVDDVFGLGQRTGNCLSLDPGARDLLTGFDGQRRTFNTYLDGLDEHTRLVHGGIAHAQSKRDRLGKETVELEGDSEGGAGRRARRARRRGRKKDMGKLKKGRTTTKESRNRRKSEVKAHPYFVRPNDKSIDATHSRLTTRIRLAQNATVNSMVAQYDLVVLPEFATARMIKRKRRRQGMPFQNIIQRDVDMSGAGDEQPPSSFALPKKSRATLARFGHRQFRQRLVAKAQADPSHSKDVLISSEEFTTKQHPFQRGLHLKIGSSADWRFDGMAGKRDCVGAYNILLRAITKDEVSYAPPRGPR